MTRGCVTWAQESLKEKLEGELDTSKAEALTSYVIAAHLSSLV